jgi:hypothetical protein
VYKSSLETKSVREERNCNLREGISHSIGNIDSTPCTNWKGENLVVLMTEVRYAQSVGYNIIFQSDLIWLTIFCKMVLRELLTISTFPFSWE